MAHITYRLAVSFLFSSGYGRFFCSGHKFPWLRKSWPPHSCLSFSSPYMHTPIARPYPCLGNLFFYDPSPFSPMLSNSLLSNLATLLSYYCTALAPYDTIPFSTYSLTTAVLSFYLPPHDTEGEQDGRGRCVCGGTGSNHGFKILE